MHLAAHIICAIVSACESGYFLKSWELRTLQKLFQHQIKPMKIMRLTRLDFIIWLLLIAVPVFCIIIFFLPVGIQDTLKTRTDNPNPLTFITSTFVHANIAHLLGNIIPYVLFGIILYGVNKFSGYERFFMHSMLLMVVLLPLIYNVAFLAVNTQYHWNFISFGLSLVVGGLMGLVAPSLSGLLHTELQNKLNRQLFYFSIVFLTAAIIVFPYINSGLYSQTIFVLPLIIGSSLLAWEFWLLFKTGLKGEKIYKNKMLMASLVLFVYFLCLPALFPTNIVGSEGNIVNIFAHYFGIFFGLFLGLIVPLDHQ